MSRAFQYRPKFVDIRVRPPVEGEEERAQDVHALKPGERACDHAGCRTAAATRAPKSRHLMNEHYWFCQRHAAEYNKQWDFFAGMSEGEIRKEQEDRFTGGRPTWDMRASNRSREAAASAGRQDKAGATNFADPFGVFGAARARADRAQARAEEAAQRMGKLERNALADLDLDPGVDAATIKAKYIDLVKRCHPDTNGGDRSAEHKLQRVIKAYKTLQKAKLA
ncbi:MAG: molecular chaperone DnaJ [Caulobacterales bacterium 68-7]|nr:J domain-containing protein [Caulobacterales bacterium]OJU13118.1 MAG: molecular chaperone DnaJ [Caulobacterales bacterium 68-7]